MTLINLVFLLQRIIWKIPDRQKVSGFLLTLNERERLLLLFLTESSPRLPPLVPPKPKITAPWFSSTCSSAAEAAEILKACRTIEVNLSHSSSQVRDDRSIQHGNFLVRASESKDAKYSITLWSNQKVTNIRIVQLDDGKYQADFDPTSNMQIPVRSTKRLDSSSFECFSRNSPVSKSSLITIRRTRWN